MPPHAAHLCVSPDGRLAYLSVHKNASTTLNFHFQRRLGWGRAWPEWFGQASGLKDRVVDPDPEEVLVVTRRDPDRFFSGLATIDYSHDWAAAPWDDPHLWPLGRFLAQWQQFEDRFVFVDIDDINGWLVGHGLPPTDDRLNVRKL